VNQAYCFSTQNIARFAYVLGGREGLQKADGSIQLEKQYLALSLSPIKNHSFVHLGALVKWSSSVAGGGTGNLVSRKLE